MEGAEVLTKFTADTSEVEKAQEEVGNGFSTLKTLAVGAITAITAAVDAMALELLGTGIEYNRELETYTTRLATLTGSAEKANDILEQIKKDAMSTPFDVKSLVDIEGLLLSTGLDAQDVRADILALGDAVSATGGGNAELKRMAQNLQQIKNAGKASAMDLKQFAMAGIDINGIIADYLGESKEYVASLKASEISYEMITGALRQASEEGGRYFGAMEAQSQTYNGAMGNLKESVQQFAGSLSEGLFKAIEGLIPKITEMVNWLNKNKEVVIAIAVPLIAFLNILTGLLIISKITSLLTVLWGVIIANPIGLIIALIGALVAGFIYLWNNCEGFRNFWIGLWEKIKDVVMFVVSKVVGFIANIVNSVKNAIDFLKTLKDVIVTAFTNAVSNITNFGKDMIKGLWNGMNSMKDWVIEKVKGMGKSILEGLKKVLGINSPSKEFAIVGHYSAEGYVEGLEDMQKEVDTSIQDTFNPFTNSTLGSMTSGSPTSNITINNSMEFDALGQLVNSVKTFSGGAKNDYNYVGGY